jgi:hypothetical protein
VGDGLATYAGHFWGMACRPWGLAAMGGLWGCRSMEVADPEPMGRCCICPAVAESLGSGLLRNPQGLLVAIVRLNAQAREIRMGFLARSSGGLGQRRGSMICFRPPLRATIPNPVFSERCCVLT